ncbi:MAG: class I SAM-dependent methyltransferase [Kiritimatiellae bacterium]|nr:class I SAM-dependent methyltransferase [Kiritimatiellia bacterium]
MICRICDHNKLSLVLDLGIQPWGNHFLRPEEVGREPQYPLRLVCCEKCQTAQLDYTVPKEVMFSDHTYVSGTTATLTRHFAETAAYVNKTFFASRPDKSVLDIGSNDGTQLLEYKKIGYDILGVESCARVAAMAQKRNVPTEIAFFNEELAQALNRRFTVINASGIFFHLEDLHSVTAGIRTALQPNGVFVVQFLYMKQIVENCAFDQIYHEHLLYYNLKTIETLLNRHGLASFDAYFSPVHGGSVILFVTHAARAKPSVRLRKMREAEDHTGANNPNTYRLFAVRAAQLRKNICAYLERMLQSGKTVYGLGAPVKGNTLLNYCNIDADRIRCLVERNPMRAGLISPGMHIPIIIESEVKIQPNVYFVLAWNFKQEILIRYAALIKQGVEFYFPINPKETA